MSDLACDPGLAGAFALLHPVEVLDMPVYVAAVGRKGRNFIDERGVLGLLRAMCNRGASRLVIEQVGGAPGQSAPAAFGFGFGVGVVTAMAIAEGYVIERVAPAVWKRALKVPADKCAARHRASELLPLLAGYWPLQKHHGRAEAAMLALYAERYLK